MSDRVRERLNARTTDACLLWFTRMAKELDTALRAASDEMLAALRADLAEARRSAEQTLHMRLSDVDDPSPPTPPQTPRFDIGEEIAWRELITTTIARHLPAPVRRRRLHHHLTDWADTAVTKPFGRARAALQDWLEAATRDTERGLRVVWDSQVAGLRRGVDAAVTQWDRTDTEISTRQELLAEHLATVDRALHDLDRLSTRTKPGNPTPGGE